MSSDIKIRKGLNLRLKGAASNTLKTAPASTNYAINPTDFHGVFPKLVCKEGTSVQAGQPCFFQLIKTAYNLYRQSVEQSKKSKGAQSEKC